MPISGPSSYITVVPSFINHWADAHQVIDPIELDGQALGVGADVGMNYLTGLHQDLLDARDTLETTLLEANEKSAIVLGDKTWLHAQIVGFNKAVRADHSTSNYPGLLPDVPQVGFGREKFNRPVRTINKLWPKVNTYRAALTPPKTALVIPTTGATVAAFAARLALLVTHQDEEQERDEQAALDRLMRDAVQEKIDPVLVLYRAKIQSLFTPDTAIFQSLPAISDDGSGTPQAGALTGSLNQDGTEVTLTGTPSASGSVTSHQLRASVGPAPSADDETLRASFTLGQTIQLTSDYGLGVPGAMVHWRLIAITADGHEKGTPWLSFQRPL